MSQLNNDKNSDLIKHCSIAAIACSPTIIGKQTDLNQTPTIDTEFKSPLISSIEHHLDHLERLDHHQINHRLDHQHLPQSYHHLVNLDQNYSDSIENKFRNKNLRRSATLAECNWIKNEQDWSVDHLVDFDLMDSNLDHLNTVHSLQNDLHQSKMNAQMSSNNKLSTNCISSSNFMTNNNIPIKTISNNLNKFDKNKNNFNKLNNSHSSSTSKLNQSKLNASSLATVISAHNKFLKLKNFARANSSKHLPPAR